MTSFDYLTVLVSIVLGLAITNVLTRLAAVISARDRIRFYWPPVAWAIWLFFLCVQHWWAEWGVRHTLRWTFLDFWLLLLVPVVLFLLSALVLPERFDDEMLNLEDWYINNRAWFFALLALVPILSIAEEITRTGHMASMLNFAFLLAFDAMIVFMFVLTSRRAQEWLTAQAMVVTLIYVGLLYFWLPK